MLQYYKDFWMNSINFNGRSRRAAYWYVVLINVIIGAVLGTLAQFSSAFGVLSYLYSLAALIPTITLSVRRLHDIGRCGWWYLLALIPLVGQIILLVWFIREGDHGDNAYGPDPKAVEIL